ncbi:MAG: preprotein translocase subunit SecG [Cytophagaceae bacterium]|nr:preprotein translocase subunit SecG [Cytophagaceae bacterium]
MVAFITVLIVIVSVLLMLVILAQNPKGGGVNQFAGGSTQFIGVKKTGDLLEKLTWGFAITLLTLSIVANLILKPASMDEDEPTTPPTEQTEQ